MEINYIRKQFNNRIIQLNKAKFMEQIPIHNIIIKQKFINELKCKILDMMLY